MPDRPRYFCYFVLLPFGRPPSALVQHIRRIYVVNAILLFVPSSLLSPSLQPFILSRSHRCLDVHLSLTSGWVHLAWTRAGFRRCASSIGSVLIVSIRPLSSSGFWR